MPGGVLGEIVAGKRIEVASRLGASPLADLLSRAEPTTRSLRAVLALPAARFVMEIKRVSPSQGKLRDAVDPAAIARAYSGAADAISVLTDARWFGGSFADLAAVRAEFDGPLLCKDFIVDPRQIPEARLHGADAVLLMLSVLSDEEARAGLAVAARLGMDALVETHNEIEVRRAVGLGAPLIGINNRDLRTLEVDFAVTERLASLVPTDRVLVSESGIVSRADVDRLAPFVDAFLVGSSLMRDPDPAAAARALTYGRVKVCGLTGAADIAAAHAAGASFAGLIMVPGTPRYVAPDAAMALAAGSELPVVGVFRDAPSSQVAAFARQAGAAAVQLHGGENESYINGLRHELPNDCEVWAWASVGVGAPRVRSAATRTLFDSGEGGTGRAFDWRLLEGEPELAAGILAGGLSPTNASAAARVGAWALDVGSGVERAAGMKDVGKLASFFDALRAGTRKTSVLHDAGAARVARKDDRN